MQLKPSRKAVTEIISASRLLGKACTWQKLKELTGYPTPLIQEALRNHPKYQPATKGPPPKLDKAEDTPTWVEEIKANTGLDCVHVHKTRGGKGIQEWLLLAPTGVPILKLIGSGTLIQSVQKLANPAGVLQGLTANQVDERRNANRRRRGSRNANQKTNITSVPTQAGESL